MNVSSVSPAAAEVRLRIGGAQRLEARNSALCGRARRHLNSKQNNFFPLILRIFCGLMLLLGGLMLDEGMVGVELVDTAAGRELYLIGNIFDNCLAFYT
jgi:hypothetical protein